MFYLIIFVLVTIYLILKYVYSHWERHGFPFKKPSIPFGNLLPLIQKKRSFGTVMFDLYNTTYEPFIGIYLLFRPAILVKDAELVRHVLVKDFSSFHDRGVYCNEIKDPVSANLFAMSGQNWRQMRSHLSPTFSSGKLKNMMATILKEGDALIKHIHPMAIEEKTVEMKELMTCYSLNLIASIFFGFDINTFDDPNHQFRVVAKELVSNELIPGLRVAANFLCPKVLEFTGISSLSKTVRDFMINITTRTIEHREKNDVSRKDFMQLLLQLRNTGKVGEDGDWDAKNTSAEKTLSVEQCAAQVFVFFAAGFETSASTASFCLYELARNPLLMEKLVQEIDQEMKKTNGELTYDSIQSMVFLEKCIAETIRMYPALPILNRECTRDFPIPGSHLTIKKGTSIIISLFGMHRDPKYFPEPDKFIPDRFVEETKNYDETAYIPFGDGPRNCIGFRMGKMFAKVAIVLLLQRYHIINVDDRPIEYSTSTVTLVSKNGINLKVTQRKK